MQVELLFLIYLSSWIQVVLLLLLQGEPKNSAVNEEGKERKREKKRNTL